MESKGDVNLLGKLDVKAGVKAASKAISGLESDVKTDLKSDLKSDVKSDIEAKADAKIDAKIDSTADLDACPSGKLEAPTTPAGQLPNGPITIIDAHRSVNTESPLTAQLALSVNLLNRLLLTMMGGGGMAMPTGGMLP